MGARILVVEDSRIVARDIRQQLDRIGHEVTGSAASGEEAVRLAEETRPDLVLMDIRLETKMDGIEAAARIRVTCRIPVVFLTAYADDETVSRAGQAEPFGYLLKPFDDVQLRTTIEMALYKHRAERRLRESERRYATTLSSIGDGVIATDTEARVTFLNPVAEALTGWPLAEALGRPVADVFRIVNEDTRNTVEDPVAKVLRLGTIVGLANHTVLIARDGRESPIDDSGAPIMDDDGEIAGVVLVFRDIAHKRRMDEALHEAQAHLALVSRLSRLGEFAASIAHEVNQPLTAIVSNTDTVLRYLDQAREAAVRVVGNGHRAGEVVRSIRSLAGQAAPQMAPLDPMSVVSEVLELMRPELRRAGVAVETRPPPDPTEILADRVQLQQVVVNLLTNAIEAVLEQDQAGRRIAIAIERDGGEVLLRVIDSGSGPPPEQIGRIFEPLVTSKPEGMGLGLAICRSIVEAHSGRIWMETTPEGTTFVVALPIGPIDE